MTEGRRIARALVWAALASIACAFSALSDEAQEAFDAGDPAKAAALWRHRAQSGDAQAAMKLAQMLDTGSGITRDVPAALVWYRRAADGGLPEVAFNAAAILDQAGRGDAAAILFARAAAAGHVRAQFALATLYEEGRGVPRNVDLARHWHAAVGNEIPRARQRATALPPAEVTGDGIPDPVFARRDGTEAVLVWEATPDPRGRPFELQLFVPGKGLITETTEASALRLAVEDTARGVRWRVARRGAVTDASWQMLADPDIPPRVRILYADGDAGALRLARELGAALNGAARVTIDVARDPLTRTRVVLGRDAARPLAEDIAAYLPVLGPADIETAERTDADVVVTILGGVDDGPSGNTLSMETSR